MQIIKEDIEKLSIKYNVNINFDYYDKLNMKVTLNCDSLSTHFYYVIPHIYFYPIVYKAENNELFGVTYDHKKFEDCIKFMLVCKKIFVTINELFKNIEKFNDYTYIINNRLQFQFRFSYTDINNSIQVVNIKNNSGRTFYEYSEILGFLLSESKK